MLAIRQRIEAEVRPRISEAALDEQLLHEALGSAETGVRAAGLVYAGTADLAEMRTGRARGRFDEAGQLTEAGTGALSPLLGWWMLNQSAEAADCDNDCPAALAMFREATRYAQRFGLVEQSARSMSNELRLLQTNGEQRRVLPLMEEFVSVAPRGVAESVLQSSVAGIFDWLQQSQSASRLLERIGPSVRRYPELFDARSAIAPRDPEDALRRYVSGQDLDLESWATGIEGQAYHRLAVLSVRESATDLTDTATADHLIDEAMALVGFIRAKDAPLLLTQATLVEIRMLIRRGRWADASDELDTVDPKRLRLSDNVVFTELKAEILEAQERWSEAMTARSCLVELDEQHALSTLDQTRLRNYLVSAGFDRAVANSAERRAIELDDALREREVMTSLVAKDLRGPIFSLDLATRIIEQREDDVAVQLLDAPLTWLELSIGALTDLDALERAPLQSWRTSCDLAVATTEAIERVEPILRKGPVIVEDADFSLMTLGDHTMLSRLVAYAVAEVATHMPTGNELRVFFLRAEALVGVAVATVPAGADLEALRHRDVEQRPTLREQFVLRRLVQLLNGSFDDLSLSDAYRVVRCWLPAAQT